MPNTDERRAKNLLLTSCKYEIYTLDGENFERCWKVFLRSGPHYGKPTEIADKFVDWIGMTNGQIYLK